MQILSLNSPSATGPQNTSQSAQAQQVPDAASARADPSQQNPAPQAIPHAAPLRASKPILPAARPDTMQVARAQQAQAYLQELGTELERLKNITSAQLAQNGPSTSGSAQIGASLKRVQNLWQQRAQASGGSIDDQLRFHIDGQTRRHFTVPGLDARSLEQPQGETLSFITGANPIGERHVVSAVIPPNTNAEQQARTLDLSLAQAGVRLHLSEQGQLTLSTSEAQWPTVRESFSVQGGGIRFPARQFHRLQVTAQEDALQPQTWRTDEPSALRQTLQQIVPAQQRIRSTLESVQHALEDQDRSLRPQTSESASQASDMQAWAETFALHFSQVGEQAPYAVFSTLAPALQGLSRPRVEALLNQA